MLAIGLVGAGALAVYVKSGHDKVPHDQPGDQSAIETAVVQEQPKKEAIAHTSTLVLTPVMKGMDLTFTKALKDVPEGVDPKVFALNEYLRQIPAVPKEAKVLGVEVKDRTAMVSVTQQLENAGFGSEDEKAVLDGIAATLGLDPAVDAVTIEVGGKRVDSLGHADLSEPMPVIRPDGSSPKLPEQPKP